MRVPLINKYELSFFKFPHMKTDTSMNVMLVVFCVILIGFVLLNSRMCEAMNKKQAEAQQTQTK